MNCPYCGAPALDSTTHDDPEPRWFCIADPRHDETWIEPPAQPEPTENPSVLKRILGRLLK